MHSRQSRFDGCSGIALLVEGSQAAIGPFAPVYAAVTLTQPVLLVPAS
jgi:hypothetical protein